MSSDARPRLEVRALDCRFTDPPARALAGVSLAVAPGEMVAVLGESGAGKSTLLRCVNGLVPSLAPAECAGEILLDGDSVLGKPVGELAGRVAMVFQDFEAQLFSTNVRLEVAFGPAQLGVAPDEIARRVDAALAAVELSELGTTRDPHLLSGGQKQRLAIAGALAMRPRYLVLDEPTSMLDPTGRAEVLAIVEQQRAAGTGVLHITHDLADVLAADRAIVLDGGRVVFDGPVAGLLGEEGLLEACGLELPPIARLADALRAAGVPAPSAAGGAEALVEALWA